MVNHRQLIYKNKFSTLMALYSVEEEVLDLQRRWTPPLLQRVLEAAAAS